MRRANGTPCRWPEEAEDILEAMWLEGHTSTEIMIAINQQFERAFSRSAIMGRLHRLKQKDKGFRIMIENQRPMHPPFGRKPAIVPAKREPPPSAIVVDNRCSILELTTTTCRWPLEAVHADNQPPWWFCGRATAEFSPYCPKHHKIAYQR